MRYRDPATATRETPAPEMDGARLRALNFSLGLGFDLLIDRRTGEVARVWDPAGREVPVDELRAAVDRATAPPPAPVVVARRRPRPVWRRARSPRARRPSRVSRVARVEIDDGGGGDPPPPRHDEDVARGRDAALDGKGWICVALSVSARKASVCPK